MNAQKLKKLQQNAARGKGKPRRKKKIVRKGATQDEKKLQQTLKRIGVTQPIPNLEEVIFYQSDGKVLYFDAPRVSAGPQSNCYVVQGRSTIKDAQEVGSPPMDMSNLDPSQLQDIASKLQAQNAGDDDSSDGDVPELVENFDAAK